MDYKTVLGWLAPIIARGVAWVLLAMLAKHGIDQATAGQWSQGITAWLISGVGIAVSIYTSIKGRQTLLMTKPPKQ